MRTGIRGQKIIDPRSMDPTQSMLAKVYRVDEGAEFGGAGAGAPLAADTQLPLLKRSSGEAS